MISFLSPDLCSKTDWYYTFTTEMSSPTEVKRANERRTEDVAGTA